MPNDKEMTSDDAWEDFKSGYDEKEFDDAHKSTDAQNKETIDGKLDVIASQINEMQTDMERVVNEVPKVQGAIESVANGKIDGAGIDQVNEQNGTDAGFDDGSGFDLFGGSDEGQADENGDIMNEEEGDVEQDDDSEDFFAQDEDGDVQEVTDEEESSEDADASNEESDEEESSDEDFEPFDESEFEDDEEDKDKETAKVMQKMVDTIVSLSRKVDGMQKQIDAINKSMTVQKEKPVKKAIPIRHKQPIYKSVGTVSKPPVGVTFNSNAKGKDGNNTTFSSFANPKELVKQIKERM